MPFDMYVGSMYPTVPTVDDAEEPLGSATGRENMPMPTSASLAVQCWSSKTLEGLMSRCITPIGFLEPKEWRKSGNCGKMHIQGEMTIPGVQVCFHRLWCTGRTHDRLLVRLMKPTGKHFKLTYKVHDIDP